MIELITVPVAALTLLLWSAWSVVANVTEAYRWPSWVPTATILSLFAVCIVSNMLIELVREIRHRRKRREYALMQ